MKQVPESGPVVVITGASAGVGRAIAREFAKRHQARLGLIARGHERLEAAKREVEELGGKAMVLPADVADPTALEGAAGQVENVFGPIDVWINNAMVSMMAPFQEMTLEEFTRITQVTYLGCVHGTYTALKRMQPRDAGVILQVGSALAYRSIPLQSAYCGAKHAIVGFTESLRTELLHEKSSVQVKMVHLPAVNTPQFDWIRNKMGGKSKPVGKIFAPEVAADAVIWTIYHDRAEVQLGGPTVKAILADKIAPRWADHLAQGAYDQHITDTPDPEGRPDNLFETVPGDFGADGPYTEEARTYSTQMWTNKHRGKLMAAGALLAAAGAMYAAGRKNRV